MLVLEVLIYVIIACIVARYVLRCKWYDVMLVGAVTYALWFFTCIVIVAMQ